MSKLIIEPHPIDSTFPPFLTLIQYCSRTYITIVDNSTKSTIDVLVLDKCDAVKTAENKIIEIAEVWYTENSNRYPISIEFSKRGLTELISDIYHSYKRDYITRLIGPLPDYNMKNTIKIHRRKRRNSMNSKEALTKRIAFTTK